MSELLNKTIKRVDLKPQPWSTQHGWYGHVVYFEDGTKGEIYHCKEANPAYLQQGKVLSHIVDRAKYPTKFADKPYIVMVETLEREAQEEKEEEPSSQGSNSRFQKRGNWNKGYTPRYEDTPDIWIKKQKFISILKLYEVIIPLVVKGDIAYDNLQTEVAKHLNFILTKSDMDNLPAPPPPVGTPSTSAPSHKATATPAEKKEQAPVRQVNPEAKAGTEKNETHSIHESSEEHGVNPEQYTESQSTLFEEDTDQTKDPVPNALMQRIQKCDTKAKLIGLQRSLKEKELSNKKVMDAFLKRKNEIEKKK